MKDQEIFSKRKLRNKNRELLLNHRTEDFELNHMKFNEIDLKDLVIKFSVKLNWVSEAELRIPDSGCKLNLNRPPPLNDDHKRRIWP